MNELAFTHPFRIFMPRMVEAMNAHFHRAIALHVIHL
jgi:hypothetical protein